MRIFIIFLVVSWCFSSSSAQTAKLESEFQSWNDIQLILPLVTSKDKKGGGFDRVTVTFTGTLRVGRKNLDFLDNRAGASVDFRISKYFSLTSAVLYRKDELVKNIRRYETRLDAGAVFSKTWQNFSFRDRNMFERRFRNGRKDTNLYRSRIQINRPFKRRDTELFTPFISEEGYYDLTAEKWSQNEFYAGITRRINKRAAVDIAYVRVDAAPVNVNGLNLSLKIKLR